MATVDSLCDLLQKAGIPDKLMDKTLNKLEEEYVVEVQDLLDLRKLSGGLDGIFPRLAASRIEDALDALEQLSLLPARVRPQGPQERRSDRMCRAEQLGHFAGRHAREDAALKRYN